ncbi:MAG: acyl-CoA thioesterase [Proteobacteria bacterium]|nr:acyl-CoA thioesterase [Pseudomonadota bacterium]
MPKAVFPALHNWMEHYISYGETDGMGVLYNAEYLHLFERGRSKFCRDQGIGYAEIEKRGVILPIRQAHCRYRSPARYDDKIMLCTGISTWNRASLTFVYEMYNEDRTKLLAEGSTEHACVSPEGKPFRIPEWLIKLFT